MTLLPCRIILPGLYKSSTSQHLLLPIQNRCVCARHSGRNKHHGGCNLYPPDPLLCSQGYRGNTILREFCVMVYWSFWCGMEKKRRMQVTLCLYGVHSTAIVMLQTFNCQTALESQAILSYTKIWDTIKCFPNENFVDLAVSPIKKRFSS